MPEIPIKQNDTIALNATLPRDLTDADTVVLHVKLDTIQTIPANIEDATEGEVAVPLSNISFNPGTYPIEWEITYNDGTEESLPATDFDYITVSAELS